MKLKLLSAALLLISSGTASVMADAVLSINGHKVEKTIASISFDGDHVKMIFADDTSLWHDMGEVSFSFLSYGGIESVSTFNALKVTVGDRLKISGLSEGCVLKIYDLKGRLLVQTSSSGNTCLIDISHLEGGAYILKAGNEIVKFIKR